ncbi:MAG: hypothetical protein PUF13_00310 [Lachnospiraceae bacterium]|nr:hypothetical protein [Lachnospiraceae bacterium]
MGKLDHAVYSYLSKGDRFADLFNGSLFHGEQVLCGDLLIDSSERCIRKDESGNYKETDRDIRKTLQDGTILQIFAEESQSYVSYVMPLRCMNYDVRDYLSQVSALEIQNRKQKKFRDSDEYLSGLCADDRLIPVYTVVLYWGEKNWTGPRTLSDMMEFSDDSRFKELFCDYTMNLVCINEIDNLEDYKTDLQAVFRLLQCRGEKEKLHSVVKSRDEYSHLPEDAYDVLTLFLSDKRLELKKEEVYIKERGEYDMCQALTELIEDGKQEGIKEGENRLLNLQKILIAAGKMDELSQVILDETYRQKMYQEYAADGC